MNTDEIQVLVDKLNGDLFVVIDGWLPFVAAEEPAREFKFKARFHKERSVGRGIDLAAALLSLGITPMMRQRLSEYPELHGVFCFVYFNA
jgi:hypothetical protein